MEFLKHKPWRRALVGGLCVLGGQSLFLYDVQRAFTGDLVAISIALVVFGGVLIVSALLDDAVHPHSH